LRETWLEDFMIMDAFPCAISNRNIEIGSRTEFVDYFKRPYIGLKLRVLRFNLPTKIVAPV